MRRLGSNSIIVSLHCRLVDILRDDGGKVLHSETDSVSQRIENWQLQQCHHLSDVASDQVRNQHDGKFKEAAGIER